MVRAIRNTVCQCESGRRYLTDKACKPVNVMGMTKAIQERIFIEANLGCPDTRFVCVRYGNVLASRGSVIPLFQSRSAAAGQSPSPPGDDALSAQPGPGGGHHLRGGARRQAGRDLYPAGAIGRMTDVALP